MGRRPEERRAPTWGSPERKTSWPAALLTAAILSSCFLLTQTQTVEIIPVRMEPSQPLKGGIITLTPEGRPSFITCSWHRGEGVEANRIFTYISVSTPPEQQNGPKFTGRETAGPGCSLHIRNLTMNDSGHYTVTKTVSGGSEAGRIHIEEVLEKLFPPYLWPEEFFVKEHMNITLNCTTSEHSSVIVSWFKDGKPVPAKAIPSEQNRTLTIPDISKDDEGLYTCEARNPSNSAMSNPSKVALETFHITPAVGTVSVIVVLSLAIAALVGTLLFCFFRKRHQKSKSSKQMEPTSPVYENTCPSVQVMPENSSGINNTYEELKHGNQAVYDQLKW